MTDIIRVHGLMDCAQECVCTNYCMCWFSSSQLGCSSGFHCTMVYVELSPAKWIVSFTFKIYPSFLTFWYLFQGSCLYHSLYSVKLMYTADVLLSVSLTDFWCCRAMPLVQPGALYSDTFLVAVSLFTSRNWLFVN